MVLSPETTDYFFPNSVVIGYNIARIFEPLTKDISQEGSPTELIRRSTPLAAPVVMMSQDGAEIVLQDVYQIPNEVSLFREDRAERIIDELSVNYSNFIIHKDGRFYPDEIIDIKKTQRSDRLIIPVSIISDLSPRLFSSLAKWNYIPKMGTVIKLSNRDFLMATPLTTTQYEPRYRGWPNTILVTIHEDALENELSSVQKMQILYQIWALTRVHMGSQLPTRKPISIHYSNSMATFLRKAGNPQPQYFKNFGRKRNRHGYISKIFL
jgi:argonaute-like protein implicated in RNA metabolism and viral defense